MYAMSLKLIKTKTLNYLPPLIALLHSQHHDRRSSRSIYDFFENTSTFINPRILRKLFAERSIVYVLKSKRNTCGFFRENSFFFLRNIVYFLHLYIRRIKIIIINIITPYLFLYLFVTTLNENIF